VRIYVPGRKPIFIRAKLVSVNGKPPGYAGPPPNPFDGPDGPIVVSKPPEPPEEE
jgi:hypothetical protein